MKIAIFENEYDSVKGAFEAANLLYFNNKIDIEVFVSSQNADINTLQNFSVLFIDIDLSTKSQLDGFGLIKKIEKENPDVIKKIVILTGNNRIQESLLERGIGTKLTPIVIKPTNYEEVAGAIKKIVPTKDA